MSLDLDPRQRAMLAEMQVQVWWPAPDPAVARSGEPAAPQAAQSGAPGMDLDWPQLVQAVRQCTACGLCDGRRQAVMDAPAAAGQADWLIVGEPPDEQEERAGAPFAGPAGQLLDNMLRAVQRSRGGLGSAGARLTNVVKCRPAQVRNPAADELAQCAVFLRREIALVQPRVILAMGRFAALSLLAADYPETVQLPFGKIRGQVYRYQGIPVVVTYHPVKLLRAPLEKANAWVDLCLAQELARTPA